MSVESGGICQYGQVVGLTSSKALIELSRARCAGCSGRSACLSRSLFQGWFDQRMSAIEVERAALTLGQTVRLAVRPGRLNSLALVTYGLPLLGLLLGLAAGAVAGSDGIGLAAGLAGFYLGLLGARRCRPEIDILPL